MTAPELRRAEWRRLRAKLIATREPICHICGGWIDTELSGRHPHGPTIDHIQPRNLGGLVWDENNCALAHHCCNSSKRDRTHRVRPQEPEPSPHSRNW